MSNRKNPARGEPDPEQILATYKAIQSAISPSEKLQHRTAVNGKSYLISSVFELTTTQGSAYFYVRNSDPDEYFTLVTDKIKARDGNINMYVRDEPTLDPSTFDSVEFKNLRSDIQPGPNQDAFFGYDDEVTISDTGRLFDEDFITASSGSVGTNYTGAGENGGVSYIVAPESDALLEIENDSSNTVTVSISSHFQVPPDVPDLME
jgi:hypothetical protein